MGQKQWSANKRVVLAKYVQYCTYTTVCLGLSGVNADRDLTRASP